MDKFALMVRLDAKPGKEAELAELLRSGLSAVEQEPKTTTWFAMRLAPSIFGIFDTFPDESGRQAHLAGRVARGADGQGAGAVGTAAGDRRGGSARGEDAALAKARSARGRSAAGGPTGSATIRPGPRRARDRRWSSARSEIRSPSTNTTTCLRSRPWSSNA